MPRWLKWTGIGCGGLISLIVVIPFLAFLFANSFWVFVLSLVALFVIAGIVGRDAQDQGDEQSGGFASALVGILVVAVLVFGVTATGKAIGRAVSSDPEPIAESATTPAEDMKPQATIEETTTPPPETQPKEVREEDDTNDSEENRDRRAQQSQDQQEQAPPPEPGPAAENPLAQLGTVVNVSRVVDGDTVEVSPAIDSNADVRLIGVDTPETYGGVEPYGRQASAFAESVLSGQRVALEFDVERIDQYGRLLAYVYLPDGSMFNETLVRQGYAQVATFPPNVRYTERFLAAQEQARLEGAGLWGLPPGQLCELADRGNGIGGGCAVPPPEPTPEPAPEPAPAPQPAPSGTAPHPPPPDVDCSDFPALGNLQDWYFPGDPHRLDADDDGLACEAG